MDITGSLGRRATVALSVLLGVVLLLSLTPSTPVAAAPGANDADEHSDSPILKKVIEASNAYSAAESKLAASRARAQKLKGELRATENGLSQVEGKVRTMAVTAYRDGGVMAKVGAVLSSRSTQGLMDKMSFMDQIHWQDQQQINALRTTRTQQVETSLKLDKEIADQQKQRDVMARRKAEVEKIAEEQRKAEEARRAEEAKKAAEAAQPPPPPAVPVAAGPGVTPVPRNPDGSLPPETCLHNGGPRRLANMPVDPTNSNLCVTPRTLHAYYEIKKAGFSKYVACSRTSDSLGTRSQHLQGKACDWSTNSRTFLDSIAAGEEKDYGDRLAAWLVANHRALGVHYVIWWRQIWSTTTGQWTAYKSGSGAAESHRNHVHLSMH